MHTVFALLCFVVVIHWLIFPYPSGLLHWHCGNLTIAPVPAKQPWWIWINTSCEFIMNDCITTTKQSTTKPCAYFLGYTVPVNSMKPWLEGRWSRGLRSRRPRTTQTYVVDNHEKQEELSSLTSSSTYIISDSKVYGANVGPTCGRQDPAGPHVGHMNIAIWDMYRQVMLYSQAVNTPCCKVRVWLFC